MFLEYLSIIYLEKIVDIVYEHCGERPLFTHLQRCLSQLLSFSYNPLVTCYPTPSNFLNHFFQTFLQFTWKGHKVNDIFFCLLSFQWHISAFRIFSCSGQRFLNTGQLTKWGPNCSIWGSIPFTICLHLYF